MKFPHRSFKPDSGDAVEEHFFAAAAERGADFRNELDALWAEYTAALTEHGLQDSDEFLLRFHLSDPANQAPELRAKLAGRPSFISVTGQAPANRARVALEAWHWKNWRLLRNYKPFWFQTDTVAPDSYAQTAAEFAELENALRDRNLNVERDTVRTWLYCRDVDNNYAGLVRARNDFFAPRGLRPDTHFIASTGIEGQCEVPGRLVRMDSLSIGGIVHAQQIFLSAPEMLSPTALYGVSFERGTRIVYGDRSHYFISGTASIDKAGRVLHEHDVRGQARRIADNVAALLECSGGSLADLRWGTLYLRDVADAEAVLAELDDAGIPGDLPLITVKAPVCRPSWLAELECVAVNRHGGAFPPLA